MRMRFPALWLSVALLSARVAESQCPDGSPPPCLTRRVVQSSPQPAAAIRARHFLMLPFKNVTRKPDQDWLVSGGPLMLSQGLGQFSDIEVIPDERLSAARRKLRIADGVEPDATQLRHLADETTGWTVVSGSVIAAGPTLRISAQSMDAVTSKVLTRAEVTAPIDADPRDAFDMLSLKLLEPLGVSATKVSLAALTTASIDAYRAYAKGTELFNHSRFREAAQYMRRAVQLDSSFAMAWFGLAAAATNANGIQELLNPMNPAYQALEQAGRLTSRLPPRQGQLVTALNAVLHGEFRRARRLADSLARSDPRDVDAAYWSAAMEYSFGGADTTVRPARLLLNVNRALELTRSVVDQDPSRAVAYQAAIMIYGLGGGMLWGNMFGFAREYGSFAATIMQKADAVAVPVFDGDTLRLIPQQTFDSLPETERLRLRRQMADAAWQWVERYLISSPHDAEPHAWASRVAETRGEYERAYQELRIADSLGVQSLIENKTGRMLSAVLLSGRLKQAADMADSMLTAGSLTSAPFLRTFDRRRAYGVTAFLLDKRWDRAARMAEVMGKPPGEGDACVSLAFEIVLYDNALVPKAFRQAAMDTVRAHITEVEANPILAPCARMLSTRLLSPPPRKPQ